MRVKLFVYGTLKRGFAAHARYCAKALEVVPAWTRGHLLRHTDGYPVLLVPARNIHGLGTRDALGDSRAGARLTRPGRAIVERAAARASIAAPKRVEGQLLSFEPYPLLFSALDTYEGYVPGKDSLFVRALIDVTVVGSALRARAWTYVAGARMPCAALVEVESGVWRGR